MYSHTSVPSPFRAFRALSDQKNIVADRFSVRVRSELSEPSPIKKILSLTDFLSELGEVWARNGAGSDMSEQASDRISCLRCYMSTDIFSSFSIHSSEDLSVIMDSEKLIELVKLHVGLYDLSSPNYSDSTWKEKTLQMN
ncbi:hypothetical protein QTP88_026936 [Uroleucon formosanum]